MTVLREKFATPYHLILYAAAGRMSPCPQFQVLYSIIGSVGVLMMNLLLRVKLAANMHCHYKAMFGKPGACPQNPEPRVAFANVDTAPRVVVGTERGIQGLTQPFSASVSIAKAVGMSGTRARFDRAGKPFVTDLERLFHSSPVAGSLIVAMAVRSVAAWPVASGIGAYGSRMLTDGEGGVHVGSLPRSAVMRDAVAAAVQRALAPGTVGKYMRALFHALKIRAKAG